LIHNMCRLPQADGTWMIVKGGMGTVARTFEGAARKAGARFRTEAPVAKVVMSGGAAKGVVLANGEELSADVVVVGADPYRLPDRFAPGTSDRVVDTFPLAPPDTERHFGLSRGHIHPIDNSFGFSDRRPYAPGVPGLYACSAGCHPGGSVIGAAGHNAAQ